LGRAAPHLSATAARRRGAFYTPPAVASALCGWALDEMTPSAVPVVADPACGDGVFLEAAADELVCRGVPPATVMNGCLRGIDIDDRAVAATRRRLVDWASRHGVDGPPPDALRVGDGLSPPGGWIPSEGFDVVVGNPPFLAQLRADTARDERASERARELLGGRPARYADEAGLFLAAAGRMTRRGGAVAMLQPVSLLGASDAAPVRDLCDEIGSLSRIWLPGEQLFDVDVSVVAIVVAVGRNDLNQPIELASGHIDSATRPAPTSRAELAAAHSWAPLVADVAGVPPTPPPPNGSTLGDIATLAADFRDEYYALARVVREATEEERRRLMATADPDPDVTIAAVVTSGAVRDGHVTWGETSIRFAKRRWSAPVVDRTARNGPTSEWYDRRLVPKVLVATQTRVLRAAPDVAGVWAPVTPLITVVPKDPADLRRVAGLLSRPEATAWIARRTSGTALSSSALRPTAPLLRELPMWSGPTPPEIEAWYEQSLR